MEQARILASEGAVHGTVVVAGIQTAGRGRSGRTWISPAGNLHATIVLRPGGEPRRAPELGFVVALAVAAAVDDLAGPGTALKWPNDVLRRGAKLAGILLERLDDGAVLAGIGANLRHRPEGLPYPATSLAELGCDAGPELVLDQVRVRLGEAWAAWQRDGFAPVLRRWSAYGPRPRTVLQVRNGGDVASGRFAGLDGDGALLLDTDAGRRRFVAGDVLF